MNGLIDIINNSPGSIEVPQEEIDQMFPDHRYDRQYNLRKLLMNPEAEPEKDYPQSQRITEFCERHGFIHSTDGMGIRHFFQKRS